ncbi:hypothetical protein FRX31_007367, partial [Thalictrum thalictroides]
VTEFCSDEKERVTGGYGNQTAEVATGDVILIGANSGTVKKVDRSDILVTEFDLTANEYVPKEEGCTKGDSS